jgi:predicted nucleotidyltransferase
MRATKESILHYLQELQPEFKQQGIASLALFGSYAKGNPTVYSDIDIAISKNSDFSKTDVSSHYFDVIGRLKEKLGKKFHKNVDIFDLDSQSPFKQTIEQELVYV